MEESRAFALESPLSAVCIVCHQEKVAGMRIFGQFLCQECERSIVQTDVGDSRYAYYIECMRQIWLAALS